MSDRCPSYFLTVPRGLNAWGRSRLLGEFLFFKIALSVLFAQISLANGLLEHQSITNQAISNVERCLKSKITDMARQVVILANVEEDTNLIQKWIWYSHFYSPIKDVSTWRGTSMHRVSEAQMDINDFIKNIDSASLIGIHLSLRDLGHIIHHVQDSCVPSHVVPIKHWLGDAFENYKQEIFPDPMTCAEIQVPILPVEQLHLSAQETLVSLEDSFRARLNGRELYYDWSIFWTQGSEKFGFYGWAGNSFGEPVIKTASGRLEVDPEEFHEFWKRRREQAYRRTSQLIYWYFNAIELSRSKTSRYFLTPTMQKSER